MEKIKLMVNEGYNFDVIVELSEDNNVNSDFVRTILSVLTELTRVNNHPPPAGIRTIRIFHRPEGPIVDSTSNTYLYQVGLNPPPRCYNQLAYQLAHEFCHIVSDPRRSNWFVESCCEMMSHILLKRLSKVWSDNPPCPSWTTYAPKFTEYSEKRIRKCKIAVLGNDRLPSSDELLNTKHTLITSSKIDRMREGLIAYVLFPIFEISPENLHALEYLGKAFTEPPISLKDQGDHGMHFSFKKWEKEVPRTLKEVVKEIRKKLGEEE